MKEFHWNMTRDVGSSAGGKACKDLRSCIAPLEEWSAEMVGSIELGPLLQVASQAAERHMCEALKIPEGEQRKFLGMGSASTVDSEARTT